MSDSGLALERATISRARMARTAVQSHAPPGRLARPVVAPRSTVTLPSVVRIGEAMPFSREWAVIAKIARTVSARRLPVALSTVRRETQPRVRTMPAPKARPPTSTASHGRSEAMKR